jgi:hypothetical protein
VAATATEAAAVHGRDGGSGGLQMRWVAEGDEAAATLAVAATGVGY